MILENKRVCCKKKYEKFWQLNRCGAVGERRDKVNSVSVPRKTKVNSVSRCLLQGGLVGLVDYPDDDDDEDDDEDEDDRESKEEPLPPSKKSRLSS